MNPGPKRFKRALLNNRVSQSVLAALLAALIWAVFVTSRKRRFVNEQTAPYLRGEANAIFAFWHGRMMVLPAFCPPRRIMRVLSSRHRDGALISHVIHHFGQETICGSSSRGGAAAFKEALRALDEGDNVSITPDGPRGPHQTLSEGILVLARLSGKPILPITFSSSRRVHFRSWDRFCFALPFGRIVFSAGAPFSVSPDDTDEALDAQRMALENIMREQVRQADELAGGNA